MAETSLRERAERWLRSFATIDNARRYRWVVEALASVLYFGLLVGPLTAWAGVAGFLVVVLFAVTLVLYRSHPALALTIGAIATLVSVGTSYVYYTGGVAVYLPLMAVFFGAAAYGHAATRWLALSGTIFASFAVAIPIGYGGGLVMIFQYYLLAVAIFVLAWVAGMLVAVNRSRRAAQTGEIRATVKLGEAKQEVTLEQERNRVARDVHDIVAHSLAVVIAQADGARYGAKNVPAPVVEALENIAITARAALTDVRVLLGELRHNEEAGPQPGMNDLDALIRGFRDSGLKIEWNSYGTAAELVGTPALAVYRIVQEALTNALRHGDRSEPVELVFDWGTSSIAVIVTNGMPAGATAGGAGHGIPGMRERATLAGGELEASDGTNGRFRVRATIPFQRETPLSHETAAA